MFIFEKKGGDVSGHAETARNYLLILLSLKMNLLKNKFCFLQGLVMKTSFSLSGG
jgi:hypothetical protein